MENFISKKEFSFCHKLEFSNPYILAFQCQEPKIFQTMNYIRSNNNSLKYQMLTPDCKDIRIRQFEFVTRTQFLCLKTICNKIR